MLRFRRPKFDTVVANARFFAIVSRNIRHMHIYAISTSSEPDFPNSTLLSEDARAFSSLDPDLATDPRKSLSFESRIPQSNNILLIYSSNLSAFSRVSHKPSVSFINDSVVTDDVISRDPSSVMHKAKKTSQVTIRGVAVLLSTRPVVHIYSRVFKIQILAESSRNVGNETRNMARILNFDSTREKFFGWLLYTCSVVSSSSDDISNDGSAAAVLDSRSLETEV
mmetsp:Transcript_9775/g.14528  ORF Transcript_9775/g.14528 Transcript_9775/m.14528 type:complete len:224 (-) Transcript_9775:646-1317(-)